MSCPQKRESSTLKLYLKSKIYKKKSWSKRFFLESSIYLALPWISAFAGMTLILKLSPMCDQRNDIIVDNLLIY
ncbi:hypothetical protein APHACPA_0719 [Rickettsia amblyommatis str. Ac/Pa]|uniref:Uncharacterized protein n=1 Tax=Rickettsia amblyommatis str. Ac/Pa TaxID=1359164 RepID=A0A0F3N1E1_RICAM|nr:hypothetical protein APHACPA_0719 [Rickettsia amblyommatis str. Ac/Pa]